MSEKKKEAALQHLFIITMNDAGLRNRCSPLHASLESRP
jgi:hypothetical protein